MLCNVCHIKKVLFQYNNYCICFQGMILICTLLKKNNRFSINPRLQLQGFQLPPQRPAGCRWRRLGLPGRCPALPLIPAPGSSLVKQAPSPGHTHSCCRLVRRDGVFLLIALLCYMFLGMFSAPVFSQENLQLFTYASDCALSLCFVREALLQDWVF